ncbi:zf-HC2 domain-containing protein [Gottfriedia acidiceleris]|uniref:zf-HC2 domain-containing protein n=1 Tax=Gottfriedia acidiceleris TaxID=371036 RepID=UPI002F26B805
MNNKCNIVRDLLPSYIDNICSKESNQFIEEHLTTCLTCGKILDTMKSDINISDEIYKIERLETKKPFKKVSGFLNFQKKFTNYILIFALISLLFGIYFLANSNNEMKKYKEEVNKLGVVEQEKKAIMNDAINVLGDSSVLTNQKEEQLLKVFEKYNGKLNLLAIFPNTNVEDWIKENALVRNQPTTIYPIDYQKAAIVIGNEGIIGSKEKIIPSDYDLGTVVMENGNWVVQYEYKTSYENIIEKYHQLKYYGPNTWSFYQLPILLFSIFTVLCIVWLFLKKNNSQLKGLLD